MVQHSLPLDFVKMAVPLNECDDEEEYQLHYYKGFNPSMAHSICKKYLTPIVHKYGIPSVDIYLYIIDHEHRYHEELNWNNCNNGYTMFSGQSIFFVSIVVFRYLFWPKTLLHEIFHVLWRCGNLPNCHGLSPKYDESIVEFYAVEQAIDNGYIKQDEYNYYKESARRKILENVFKSKVEAGSIDLRWSLSISYLCRRHVWQSISFLLILLDR